MVSRETWRDVSRETLLRKGATGPENTKSAKQPHASKNLATKSTT
jgi:hypothetical protein